MKLLIRCGKFSDGAVCPKSKLETIYNYWIKINVKNFTYHNYRTSRNWENNIGQKISGFGGVEKVGFEKSA